MTPIKFNEAHIELKKPTEMTDEECYSLWVHQSPNGDCVSCWTAPFWTRLKFLFHGKLWLGVHSGRSQPPVWLDLNKTVFVNSKN